MNKRRTGAMVKSAIVGATMVVLLVACGQGSNTRATPRTSSDLQSGEVAVDFFQNDDRVGELYVRTQPVIGDLVSFFIEVPYIGEGYRLDAAKFEFRSDVVQPLIMLEPSGGTLTQDISFMRFTSLTRWCDCQFPIRDELETGRFSSTSWYRRKCLTATGYGCTRS